MKKYLLLTFLLSFVLCTGFSKRYYIETDSKAKAMETAAICNGKLESYADGIGVIVVENMTTNSNLPFTTAKTEFRELDVKLRQDYTLKKVDAENIAPYTNEDYDMSEQDMKAIRWTNTYKNNITGKGIVVAVIDTGCKTNHEDLKNNIAGTYNATNGTKKVTDDDGHGTHVSGIIAASDNQVGIVGVAPDAGLYIIKVMSDDGHMYYSSIIRALKKCVSRGDISVINMSLGGTFYDKEFEDAVKECNDAGILCVSAAGNEETDKPIYPAAFGYGVRVASYNSEGRTLSTFSNYGPRNCDIAAPGDGITSTYIYEKYDSLSGTSMAAPFVSGVAALVYSNNEIKKDASGTAYVKNLIITNNDGRTYRWKTRSVKGGLDVQKIFNSAQIQTPARPTITITEQKDTGQKIVTLTGTGDIYYTIDGKDPSIYSKKYKTKIHLDTPGTHRIRAICANKRAYSYTVTKRTTVDDSVITQEQIKSATLYLNSKNTVKPGKSYTIKVKNTTLTSDKFKWSTSDKAIATVNAKGRITVSKSAKKGDSFTVSAKLGSITKKLNLTVTK